MTRYLLGASLLAFSLVQPVIAQTTGPGQSAPEAAPRQGDIIVTAPFLQSEGDILQGTSVVTGEELTREMRPTIGETLARQPGVSATSFGPSASRPVLRGLQGDRVRVLTDGIGSIDVSNTSVDHAVAINPLLAERVEVLRGPSALLFGSSAIGGVVNVIDTRIPRSIPENGYKVTGMGTYGSAANERSSAAAGDVAIGRLVLHADGSYLKTDDLEIGGHVLSRQAGAEALSQVGLPQEIEPGEDGEPGEAIDFAANAGLRKRIPNSASKTWTAGAGASLITDTGHLGVSYSHYDSFYGVPVRYATQIGQEQEAPRLDIVQNRVDLRAEVETGGGFLDRIRVRAGHATYRHYEVEENGEIATTFRNNGLEGRVEFVQANNNGWQGASGVQYFNRQFDVQGEEAFLPRNETNQTGIFTLQQFDFGSFKAEGGLRYEWTKQQAKTTEDDLRYFRGGRSYGALSGSLGLSTAVAEGVRIGLNGSRTERAPSGEELFANGGHAGTQAYELGSPDFRKERSWGIEATLHAHGDGFSFDASAYHNWFKNFIYENQVGQGVCEAAAAPSGREVELPCFQYQQANARFYGFEADASARLARFGEYTINVDGVADYVHANIRGGGPVPRIPPLRLLGGVEARSDLLTARGEVEHVFDQDRTAAFETSTDEYTLVNASIAIRPFGRDNDTTLLLSANNLFDVVARRHASFLKDFAPLSGRDLRATIRFSL
jgi:iron complex outermembrane receptor protein